MRAWIVAGAPDDSQPEVSSNEPIVYMQPPVITALRFSPDGAAIAVSGNREIILHKADGSALLKRLPGKAERLLSIAFSNDGKLLIAGGGTPAQFGEVQIWDVASAQLLHSATLTNDTVFGASLAPDASRVAVGCADNTVHVFETKTGKELYKIGNHENWVLATVFGVDSKRFVSTGRDRAVKLIDAQSGAFLENVNLLRGELSAIARHPKKDIVVIGGEERYPYIYLMDRPRNMKIADDTTLVRKIERQDGAITALDWSPDGSRIAVAGASSASICTILTPANGKLAARDTRREFTPCHFRRTESSWPPADSTAKCAYITPLIAACCMPSFPCRSQTQPGRLEPRNETDRRTGTGFLMRCPAHDYGTAASRGAEGARFQACR